MTSVVASISRCEIQKCQLSAPAVVADQTMVEALHRPAASRFRCRFHLRKRPRVGHPGWRVVTIVAEMRLLTFSRRYRMDVGYRT